MFSRIFTARALNQSFRGQLTRNITSYQQHSSGIEILSAKQPTCRMYSQKAQETFVFTSANIQNPDIKPGLDVINVPLILATDESLEGFGRILHDVSDATVENKTFEIVPWPHNGWRKLDPNTGDEAGTTEGEFQVHWEGDYFYGKNLAVATVNNTYLDGFGAMPEHASAITPSPQQGEEASIFLWMSDYHPDGAQMFFPMKQIPFVVCLGPSSAGDDIRPEQMRAFYVPAGKGVYIHPGTWHNGVYVHPAHCPTTFLTRQGKVHARISASWAVEFNSILKLSLPWELAEN
eukprot:m.48650 g.48650  ORF g.48650 m.48650 type:complete len:291 (-) comp20810_c1_seq1:71-943(-)